MQLFDSDESLADGVGAYLCDGFASGETLLVVMDEQRWYAVAMRLSARCLPVDQALADGTLIVRDAGATMMRFMAHGRPDRELFEGSVGNLFRELSARGVRLRIYGEMVNLLACLCCALGGAVGLSGCAGIVLGRCGSAKQIRRRT
jgi:hypothetical protein